MDTNPQRTTPLALEPIESRDADAPTTRQLRITIADEYVAQAAKEYQDGHVDQALWSRASLAGGNEADEALIVAAYLRARATALRMERRSAHSDAPADATRHEPAKVPRSDVQSTKSATAPRWTKKAILLVAAAIAIVVAVALALTIAAQRHVGSTDQPGASSVSSVNSARPPQATAGAVPAVDAERSGDVVTLETKVRQLKEAANWNVLVLYASEWTRKEPANAAAWNDLSVGYANLHQLDDALNAATRAVQLSPADALLWRNLGQVNLALDRLPDAATAFDNALLANAGDVVALCGAVSVAQQQGRSKDADAMAARVKAMDGNCPGIAHAEKAVPVPRRSQTAAAR